MPSNHTHTLPSESFSETREPRFMRFRTPSEEMSKTSAACFTSNRRPDVGTDNILTSLGPNVRIVRTSVLTFVPTPLSKCSDSRPIISLDQPQGAVQGRLGEPRDVAGANKSPTTDGRLTLDI